MSIFAATAPAFEAFLASVKDDHALAPGCGGAQQNARFIPRNFLNEERLDASRVASYAAQLPPAGPKDFAEWNHAHNKYLTNHIFIPSPGVHDYRSVARNNPVVCPETFRVPLALNTFQDTDFDTYLIRVVSVADIASLLNHNTKDNRDYIFSLGEKAVSDPRPDNPARQELSLLLEEAYTGAHCQHRPTFAAFYEDFLDELRDAANKEWANQIRDRLGLYHINQWLPYGLPLQVFLFRYSVREIPRYSGEADRRPIAVPVVIDHKLFEAFCPAPRELDRGRLLNLVGDSSLHEPAREVLHLFTPLQTEHLFRVGLVTTPVPEDLGSVRRDHLVWLQLLSERDNYASETDADLF
jgi:hypothetical protein